MANIKFTDLAEFMDELRRHRNLDPIDRSIVRFTVLLMPGEESSIKTILAVGTALVGNDLFRLEYACGCVWENEDNPSAYKRANDIQDNLGSYCNDLGLELRPGMYERA